MKNSTDAMACNTDNRPLNQILRSLDRDEDITQGLDCLDVELCKKKYYSHGKSARKFEAMLERIREDSETVSTIDGVHYV